MILRHGHPADLPFLFEVCHRTGHNGLDASEVVSDRLLLGYYFAAPYVVRDPHWCWTAVDEQGVAGYLVATPDSRAFAGWMNSHWLPTVRSLYPQTENPARSATETWIRNTIHDAAGVPDFVDGYPAHLHIDFLPRAQGQGLGTKLIGAFLDQLRSEGVPGFHLGVGLENTKAQAFYAKQGFQEIRKAPGVLFLGLKL